MTNDVAVAVRSVEAMGADGFPKSAAWRTAPPIAFCADWRGRNPDKQRETVVRLLWSPETLYLRFSVRYRELTVFDDAEPNGRRDRLWDRDVAEAFLQPNPENKRHYLEFEVSPNGQWIDLDVAPECKTDLKSGLRRRITLDVTVKIWTAELNIPMKSLVSRFDPAAVWRANFYRAEGKEEPRYYSAWRPTHTQTQDFHVPDAFGKLVFTYNGKL